jgi:hypothetical protein
MNVLVIPEDFRKDQFVLKPIIKAMFKELGKGNARVAVCFDPLLQGVSEALKWDRIQEVLDRHRGMVDMFLLCVDRDGDESRRSALDEIEKKAADYLPAGACLVAENAWQEVETWLLAGHDLPEGWNWKELRQDESAKENYFAPFAMERNVQDQPYEGRKSLAQEAARRYSRIRQLCPEDVVNLELRIKAWIAR